MSNELQAIIIFGVTIVLTVASLIISQVYQDLGCMCHLHDMAAVMTRRYGYSPAVIQAMRETVSRELNQRKDNLVIDEEGPEF